MKTLILTQTDVKKLLDIRQAIEDVEVAYKSFSAQHVVQPPIQSVVCPELNAETDIKSSYSKDTNMICVKTAPGYWDNMKKYGLPTVYAVINLFDGETGRPVCMMEGSLITGIRTGAAGGLASRIFARTNSKTLGVIGAGTQARMQARAIKEVFPSLSLIKVWSPVAEELKPYKNEMETELHVTIETYTDAEPVCRNSDIIVTATPGSSPIVQEEWLSPGTHICAIGADTAGKQELDPAIFKRARVFVDSRQQCCSNGETRNAILAGVFTEEDITAEIGEVLLEKAVGRQTSEEITLFDATGMSVQDNATAVGLYHKALQMGIGREIELL